MNGPGTLLSKGEGESRSQDGDFWKDNGILGGAAIIAGLINYGYHVVLAHLLGPAEYGSLATLLNLTAIMVLPASVVTLVYTRFGRQSERGIRESWGLWSVGLLLWLAMALFRMPLGQVFRVPGGLLVLFTLEIIPSLATGANRGILQHVRRYWAVGLILVLSNGFRVFAAVATWLTAYRLVALGIFEASAAGLTWGVSRWLSGRAREVGHGSSTSWVAGTALVGILNVVMGVADGMVSKHTLAPLWAGEYNGLATIGHTVQYVSGSLGTVMLTSIVADPKAHLKFVSITFGSYLFISGSAEWVFSQWALGVVRLILGPHFFSIAPYLGQYGWGMMALGLLNITLMYAVATKRWAPLAVAGVGITIWVWTLLGERSVAGMVHTTVLVMGASAAGAMGTQGVLQGLGWYAHRTARTRLH